VGVAHYNYMSDLATNSVDNWTVSIHELVGCCKLTSMAGTIYVHCEHNHSQMAQHLCGKLAVILPEASRDRRVRVYTLSVY